MLQSCYGFVLEGLVVLVGDLRFKSGNHIELLRLCRSEMGHMCETFFLKQTVSRAISVLTKDLMPGRAKETEMAEE